MSRLVTLGSAMLLGSVAVDGRAQAQTPPVQVPEIVVNAPGSATLTAETAAQIREIINRNAGSVGFVDSETLKTRYTNNLRDVLKDAPGVLTQERYGQELRVSIRGSGITRAFHTRGVEILQDGMPFNFADGSGDYYQVDPLALRAVEIYKGGNGLAYGSSYLGGAINFITPTAATAVAPHMLRIDGGSFGTWRANAQTSGIWGKVDALANLTVSHSDGYRDHARQQYEHFNGNIGYRISPDVETRFYLGAYRTDQKLPGSLTLSDALSNPRMASAAAIAGDQARNVRAERIANRTTFNLGTGKFDVDSWFMHKNLYHPIFQVLDQDGFTYGIAPRYTADWSLAGFRNETIAGARFFGGNNDARQFVNIAGGRGAQTLNARQDAYNYEAYIENRFYFFDDVALMTGAKALRNERRYKDFGGLPANPLAKADSAVYDGFNPKLGLLWTPKPDIQVFADITRSLDTPDFTDLTQTTAATTRFVPLSAQKAWTAEIGSRGRTERVSWDVTLYRSQVRDELLQFTVDPNTPASTFNAGRTIHQGIELGVSVELARNLFTAAGDTLKVSQLWNYSDFRFDGDRQYGNNRIAGVPEHVLRTVVTYRHPSGFYIAPSVDWVPTGAFVDYANTLRSPGYTLIGLQTGIDMDNGWLFYVEGRNLTDRRAIADFGTVTDARTATTAVFYPVNGRGIYAGLRYAFDAPRRTSSR